MVEKILGVDIGTASVACAIVKFDKNNKKNNEIECVHVLTFPESINSKGKTHVFERREARGRRRTYSRKRVRLNEIKNLLKKYFNLKRYELFETEDKEDRLIFNEKGRMDVWKLRNEVLKRVLSDKEFIRVLMHLANHRGQNVKKLNDKDAQKVKGGIADNLNYMKSYGYETIGQALYHRTPHNHRFKNSIKDKDFSFSVSREMIKDEVNKVFEKQRYYGNQLATKELQKIYEEITFKEKPVSSVKDMVGECTFFKGIKRAPKSSFSASEFILLGILLANKLIDEKGNETSFNEEQIIVLLNLFLNINTKDKKVSYNKIRKILKLDEKILFKQLDYTQCDKYGKVLSLGKIESKEKIKNPFEKGYYEIKTIIEANPILQKYQNAILEDRYFLDETAKIFAYYKNEKDLLENLTPLFNQISYIDKKENLIMINSLIDSFTSDHFIELSFKAIEKIIPLMKQGVHYTTACVEKGLIKKVGNKKKYLRALTPSENRDFTNPVAKKAFTLARKLINAVISKYGQVDKVHIELTREAKKSYKDRLEITTKGKQRYAQKQKNIEEFERLLDRRPKDKELEAYELFKMQEECCIYTGEKIELKWLLDTGMLAIDHILPISRSWDNSFGNKVLCLYTVNEDKSDDIPYEYFDKKGLDWHTFENRVKMNSKLSIKQKNNLLRKKFDENAEKEYRRRTINDTSYIAIYLKSFIEDNLELLEKGRNVFSINGGLTAMLRYAWGVGHKDRSKHLHHGEDAIILAFATQAQVQKLSTVSVNYDGFRFRTKEEKMEKLRFVTPMENFHQEVKKAMDEVFVAKIARRKVTGAVHDENPYSLIPQRNIARSRKKEEIKSGFLFNGGIALNGEVKRIDVFKKEGKYHFIYLYPADFEKKELPSKTIKGKEIDETYEFQFSIFKDELLHIKNKNSEYFGYFKFAESDGRFNIQRHFMSASDKKDDRISTGSLIDIKKYHVTPLGEYHEVKQEKRLGIKRSK